MIKETNTFSITIINQKYYLVTINDDVEFNVDNLTQLIQFQKEFGGIKLPVMVLCSPNATTNLDLMKYISKNENNPFSMADVFVLNSLSQKILANFYLKFATPQRPTKFFNDKVAALKWLEQYFQ